MTAHSAIRLCVKGVLNSFRAPDFQTFHKTLPFPPKTTICGMIGAALGYSPQKVNDELLENIQVGIIIKSIGGQTNDLWRIKKIVHKQDPNKPEAVVLGDYTYFVSVIVRELLYMPEYKIFIVGKEDLLHRIIEKIKNPEWAMSLGRDDELVIVKVEPASVFQLGTVQNPILKNTVIPADITGKYKLDLSKFLSVQEAQRIMPPVIYKLPTLFNFKGNVRSPAEFKTFTFTMGLDVQLKNTTAYTDGEYVFQIF